MKLFGLFSLVTMVTVILMEDVAAAPLQYRYHYICHLSNGTCVLQTPTTLTTTTTRPPQTDLTQNQKEKEKRNENITVHGIYVSRTSRFGSRIRRWFHGEIHINEFFAKMSYEEAKGVSNSDWWIGFSVTCLIFFVISCCCQGYKEVSKSQAQAQATSNGQSVCSNQSNSNNHHRVEKIPMDTV